jgi:hypothetical protein
MIPGSNVSTQHSGKYGDAEGLRGQHDRRMDHKVGSHLAAGMQRLPGSSAV